MYKSLFIFSLLLCGLGAAGQTTYTFNYTGSVQAWTVPPGVTSVDVVAKGASGGLNAQTFPGGSMADSPGHGGCVTATLTVTPGMVLNIYVGGPGADATTVAGGAGGWNGGGSGGLGYTPYAGGGGGGASDIRFTPYALADRKIVAAGGAGAGGDFFLPPVNYEKGGDGGTATGEDGRWDNIIAHPYAGLGGTPIMGGAGGNYPGWCSGASGTLGNGANACAPGGGGGGGGGLYGGGGGAWGGGGGGSDYYDPALTTAVTDTRGCNTSRYGIVTITVTCSPPVAGVIVGPPTVCQGSTATYTNPTGTGGGVWTTSNPLIATVGSTTGVVTGVAPGVFTLTYTITLPCGTATTSTTLTVNPAPANMTGNNPVCVGVSTIYSDLTPGGTWSSSVPAVGTIDPSGNFMGLSVGVTVISYTVAGCSATLSVTVNGMPAPIVGPANVCKTYTALLTDATPGGVWTSNVPAAVAVGSSTGIITGVGLGVALISYTVGGCTVTHLVSVSQPPLPIIGPTQVCQSSAIILTEFIGGGVWSSSNPTVATVTSGVVTGIAGGVVTISYTTTACPPATHDVTVNPLPAPILGPTAICVGLTTTLTDATPGGTWSSDNPDITVSPGGVVTSAMTGITGNISYTLPTGCFVTTAVGVNVPPAPIVGPDSVCLGSSVNLSNATPGGVWSSTNLAIAQVIDSSGVTTGISIGTVNISYTLPTGCYAFKPFLVETPVPASVTISGGPSFLCAGTPVTFTANAVNGGTPTFIWELFSVPLGPGDTGATYTYTPIHGDVISCFMTTHGICVINDHVADSFVLNVYPNNVSPSAVIMTTTTHDTIAYLGEVYTFFSDVTYGGTTTTYQWYVNGVAVPGATESSFSREIYNTETIYCVVNGNPPCEATPPLPGNSNSITIHGLEYVGVSSVTAGNNLSLFPNPNSGSFTLRGTLSTSSGTDVSFEVSNMLGQVVYTGKATPQNGKINQQISIDNIAPGSYLLRVNTEAGTETFHFVIGK